MPVTAPRINATLMYVASVGCMPCSPPSGCGRRSGVSSVVMAWLTSEPPLRGRDQVDDGEDHDPHHVDEVPVEAGDLDHLGLALVQLAARRHASQREQHQDPDGDVHTVEAGEDEEA